MENLPPQVKDAVDFAKSLPGAAEAQAGLALFTHDVLLQSKHKMMTSQSGAVVVRCNLGSDTPRRA
jgi:hypothetical protein